MLIGATTTTALSALGFLIKSWIESIRRDLADHMSEETEIRKLEAKHLDQFRRDIQHDLNELREDIRRIHSRIDTLTWNSSRKNG